MLIAVTDYTHIHTEGEDLGLPKVDGSFRNWFTDFSDFYVCTPAFCAELVLRVIAMGFWSGEEAYLKNPWNVLDFVIVVSSVLEYLTFLDLPLPDLSGLAPAPRCARCLATAASSRREQQARGGAHAEAKGACGE